MNRDTKSSRKRSLEDLDPQRLIQLDKRLIAYALAGAGAIALTPPANAEIVYTKADTTFSNGFLYLDLNHDGIHDFALRDYLSGYSSLYYRKMTVAGSGSGAAVIGYRRFESGTAWDASPNWPIGTNSPKPFINVQGDPAQMAESFCIFKCYPHGAWVNKTDRFLGLKFKIDEEVHYGWVRLSVQSGNFTITAKVTGYAYETTPNTTILAGDRGTGPETADGSPTELPQSLGLLSLGSLGAKPGHPAGQR
jgi:hypothetical protein